MHPTADTPPVILLQSLGAAGDAGRWAAVMGGDMAFGFPARFKRSRTYLLPEEELVAAAKSALEDLGWSYKVLWGKELHASVPFSGWTWGEDCKVRILPGGVVEAESRCVTGRLPQVFDFGRNRQNVEAFFARLEQAMGLHRQDKL